MTRLRELVCTTAPAQEGDVRAEEALTSPARFLARVSGRVAEYDLIIIDPALDLEGLRVRLEDELSRAQFEPPRIDGSLRRYRYPRRKATLIAAAVGWLRSHGSLTNSLAAIDDERQRRYFLCHCPGIGPKTASWLLRNLGYGENVAVLDVHVLRAMATAGLIETVSLPRDYEAVEKRYLAWCAEIEAPPAAFDLFLWEFQRGRLSRAA